MPKRVCIIGCGPSGLVAGIFAAREGADVTIIEANGNPCRKLLHTGGGRCNVTHEGDVEFFVNRFGDYGNFLKPALYTFTSEDFCRMLSENNLETRAEKDGCVFPITQRAADVSRVLLDIARRERVSFLFTKRVRGVSCQGQEFRVDFGKEYLQADRVIIATGGKSWPHTGSIGDGYEFAKSLGHSIVEPRAALTALIAKESLLFKLAGVCVEDMVLMTKVDNRKYSVRGPLVFADNGIGGPAVLNFSRYLTDKLFVEKSPITVWVDLFPDMDHAKLNDMIIDLVAQNPRKELAGIFINILPRSLALEICSALNDGKLVLANQLTRENRNRLVEILKGLELTITATRRIEEATITRGGIERGEIDPKTMESKVCRGLYFAGEVIDVDGPCGGYNLQIAWSTGALAGISSALD